MCAQLGKKRVNEMKENQCDYHLQRELQSFKSFCQYLVELARRDQINSPLVT